jgi:hypothetical protein
MFKTMVFRVITDRSIVYAQSIPMSINKINFRKENDLFLQAAPAVAGGATVHQRGCYHTICRALQARLHDFVILRRQCYCRQ